MINIISKDYFDSIDSEKIKPTDEDVINCIEEIESKLNDIGFKVKSVKLKNNEVFINYTFDK